MKIIDANLLIYAFDASSSRHAEALTWLEQTYGEDDLVGIPRIVQLAFIRIVSNPRAMKVPLTTQEAISRMESLLHHPKTVVIECGANHWSIFKDLVVRSGVYGASITDAFLATLSIEHGATLCSNDEGFRRYVGLKFHNPIPV